MSLPTHRDPSTSSSGHTRTTVDVADPRPLVKTQQSSHGVNTSETSSESGYEDRGEEEIEEEDGKKRKVKVVLEKKSGREVVKDIAGGPYTRPRW